MYVGMIGRIDISDNKTLTECELSYICIYLYLLYKDEDNARILPEYMVFH